MSPKVATLTNISEDFQNKAMHEYQNGDSNSLLKEVGWGNDNTFSTILKELSSLTARTIVNIFQKLKLVQIKLDPS